MGIRFEFEAYGDKLVARELTRFSDHALDARPAFDAIADQLMRSEKRRFATQGNGTWDDITDATKARKRASKDPKVRANANRVLIATGDLRRSLTVRKDEHQELIVQPRFMVFGTKLEYAEFHQKGKGVPMRKPLGFTETAKRGSLTILQRWVVTGDVGGSLAGSRSRGAK